MVRLQRQQGQELEGVPALSVHWQDWEPNEAWGTYLARCRRAAQAVDFGLARGAKQLGVRRVASEAELARPRTLRRLWRACGIPREWSVEEVNEFLLECKFTEPCVEERLPWIGATAWSFRATTPADSDFFSVDLDGDVIEFSRLGRDTRHSHDKALPMEIKQVYNGRRKQQAKPASNRAVVLAKEPPEVQDGMAVDGGGDRQRLDDGKSLPSQGSGDVLAKRPKTCSVPANAGPCIPGGMKLIDNDGQGDCLFLAVSEALVAQGRSRRSATDLRNLCATHLRKHEATYSAFWRGDAPDAEQSNIKDKGFAEYLRLIGRDKAWGGSIELAALASTLNQPIFVVRPLDGEFYIRVFGPTNSKATPLTLWFEHRHYQALVGDFEAVAAQAVKAEVGDPADRGGALGSASTLGGQTVASRRTPRAPSTLGGRTGEGGVNCAASSLGGCTASRGAKRPRASDADDDVAEAHSAPTPSKHAQCQRRFRENPLAQGVVPRFVCPHCDFVYEHPSRNSVSSARAHHLSRFHGGVGMPGPIRVDYGIFRMLSKTECDAERFAWKCPLCRFGLPEGAQASKHAKETAVAKHRQLRHPSVSDSNADYQKAACGQAHARLRALARRRASCANKRAVSHDSQPLCPPSGFAFVRWPCLDYPRGRSRGRFSVRRVPQCLKCYHLYASPLPVAASWAPSCCKRAASRPFATRKKEHARRTRTLERRIKAVRATKHGFPVDQLEALFQEAREALRRAAPGQS